jgi:3-vinyl bacteriochlorophyllide hydratase
MSASTYSREQLVRRNASIWTRVQVVLAPIQFLAFLVSLGLVIRYLVTGEGYAVTNASVLVKIGLLWLITVTGMIWEKEVFGQWFLAPQFFWEDIGNAVAIFFHNLYFLAIGLAWSERSVMLLMLVAYITYLFNCVQFVLKGLRSRQQRQASMI